MTLQIEARAALTRMERYPSRDVFVRPTGHVYWPQPGEMPVPGEVWIAGGEHGAWAVDDLARALERAAGECPECGCELYGDSPVSQPAGECECGYRANGGARDAS